MMFFREQIPFMIILGLENALRFYVFLDFQFCWAPCYTLAHYTLPFIWCFCIELGIFICFILKAKRYGIAVKKTINIRDGISVFLKGLEFNHVNRISASIGYHLKPKYRILVSVGGAEADILVEAKILDIGI